MDIRRSSTASLRLIGGVLLVLCFGTIGAEAGNGTIKSGPVKPFRPVFDLYVTELKPIAGSPESGRTRYINVSSPFRPYDPVALECDFKLADPKGQAKTGKTFATKIEVYKYGGNSEGVKVAENIILRHALFGASSGQYHRWLWYPTEQGRYMITCTVDYRYEVAETNEHNNVVGQHTFVVVFTSVPADAFKIRIASPTEGQVYDSPADAVDLKVEPVLPDWRAERVHMEVIKWDRSDPAHQGWVGIPDAFYNKWYGTLPSHFYGYYMVRATSSTSGNAAWMTGLFKTPDDTYTTEAEPVFFWVGKPEVGVAAVAKKRLPLPHVPRLKKDVPIKPLTH